MTSSLLRIKSITSHCLTDEMMCPLCGSVCMKGEGIQLMQDTLRWPSAREKAVKSEMANQLRSLVKKYPQWEERIVALVNFTYKEMET